jgi:hypothetical protein
MWLWLKTFFDALLKAFKSFIKQITQILIRSGAHYILDVAKETVEDLAQTDLTNEEKRDEAFKRIKNYARMRGLEVRDSVINTVIELAVQELKNIR